MRADSEAATALATIGVALEEMIESEEVGEEVEAMDMEGEVMMASEEVAMVALEGEVHKSFYGTSDHVMHQRPIFVPHLT